MEKYLDRDWKIVETVVIRALGSVTKEFDGWIKKLGIKNSVGVMQKTALLGTVRILTKVEM